MTRTFQTRRAAVAVAAAVLLGGIAAIIGGGIAHAAYPCGDNAPPQDVWVGNGDFFVGADSGDPSATFGRSVWACVAPGNGEPNASWAVVTVDDPAAAGPGVVVYAGGCNLPPAVHLGNDPHWSGCGNYVLEPTGANVGNVSHSVNGPGGGNGTGASVGAADTCVYVNDQGGLCPLSTGAGVTVAEGDLPNVTPVGALGATITIGGDAANTLTVTTPLGTTSQDLPNECIEINTDCP